MPRVINRDRGELLVETSPNVSRPTLPSAEEINSLYPTFLTRFENPADLSLQLGIPVNLDSGNLDPLALLFKKAAVKSTMEEKQPEERPRKYKTEMCKYFQLGCCTRADDCTFAHQISELRCVESIRGMSQSAVEAAWSDEQETQSGDPYRGGQDPSGADAHESTARLRKYKTELCKYWQQRTCKRGAHCTFAHSQTELRSYMENSEKPLQSEDDPSVTPKFSPQLAPKKYKTEMCKFWASGRCKRSHDCTFAHYASELREDSFKAETLALDEGTKSHSPPAFSTPTKVREGFSLSTDLDPLRARADTAGSGTTQTTVEGGYLGSSASIQETVEPGDASAEPNESDFGYLPTGLLD
jgi:hypothetical protein